MVKTSFLLCICCFLISKFPWTNAKALGCRPEDGRFKCRSGNSCIHRYRVRESSDQCPDGSDEGIEPLLCSDDEELCRATKRCVPRYLINTHLSCELRTKKTFPCRSNEEFECIKSKQCIPRRFVNNGDIDCSTMLIEDDSDETQVLPQCLPSEFSCNDNEPLRCIPREWVGDGVNDCDSGIDEKAILTFCHNLTEFHCQINGRCIPRYRVMDGFPDCPNATDELSPLICFAHSEFQCHDNGRCIPRSWRGNTLVNCLDGSDEVPMPSNETCVDGEFRCHNKKRCIPMSLVCDGMDHCGDCSDEIESCEEPRMFRCPTNASKCIHWEHSCDVYVDCPEGADDITSAFGFKCNKKFVAGIEITERYCSVPQWALNDSYAQCDDKSDLCLSNGTYACTRCLDDKTMIAQRQICDGVLDCPDFSDECLCSTETSTASRYLEFCNNVCYHEGGSVCDRCELGELWCPVDDLCVSADKVCDRHVDCAMSHLDEALCSAPKENKTRATNFDFDCDPVPQAVLDIVKFLNLERYSRSVAPLRAKRCNKITECMNAEDECSTRAGCIEKPSVCKRIPLKLATIPPFLFGNPKRVSVKVRQCGYLQFAFGATICNGVLECNSGLDEKDCDDQRFRCPAGSVDWLAGPRDVVSIPLEKHCDGGYPTDCVDQSDEKNCSTDSRFYCESKTPLFVQAHEVLDGKRDCTDFSDECPPSLFQKSAVSSREELIKSTVLKVLIWFMMFFATAGNLTVIITTVRSLLQKQRSGKQGKTKVGLLNNFLIINLAVADLLMGIVLLTIGVKATEFSGNYCHKDKPWRASSLCTAVGVLTVLSSEASVFTLVCITSYRLYTVWKPLASRNISLRVLAVWIIFIWLSALGLALLPLAGSLSKDMVSHMLIAYSPYFAKDTVTLFDLRRFARRIAALKKMNISEIGSDWHSLDRQLSEYFPDHAPVSRGYFGYYSDSGVCMPKFYRVDDEDQDFQPVSSAVVTFNFIALLYIAAAYVTIYRRSTRNTLARTSQQTSAQAQAMYRKITVLIATDMICWFPVCIMTFLSMSGVVLDPLAYAVSAIVLLPINSSLNPIIYATPISAVKKAIRDWRKELRQRQRSTP